MVFLLVYYTSKNTIIILIRYASDTRPAPVLLIIYDASMHHHTSYR